MQKYLLALAAVMLFSGCSMFDDKPAPAVEPNAPIKVEMEITERTAAPAPEVKAVPEKAEKAKPKAKRQAKAATQAPKPKRVILPDEEKRRGGVDGELNSVEQGYLDSIRERNKRTREENAQKVFGGWSL